MRNEEGSKEDRREVLGIDLQAWLNNLLGQNGKVECEWTTGGEASDADAPTAPTPHSTNSQLPVLPPPPSPETTSPPPSEDNESLPCPEPPPLPIIAAPPPQSPPAQLTGQSRLQLPVLLPPSNIGMPTCLPSTEPVVNLSAMQASPGMPMLRSASFTDEGPALAVERRAITRSESSTTPTPSESMPFTWSECHNLISTDAAGVLVRQPSVWPLQEVQVQLQLQLPLLFWAERRRWMWHKKWTLPKLRVHVSYDGKSMGGTTLADEPPVYAIISAGTLHDGSNGIGLYDKGLGGGECQRQLIGGETTFSSLLFQNTSFNCGTRPFHLVVTVLAPAHHPLAVRLAC